MKNDFWGRKLSKLIISVNFLLLPIMIGPWFDNFFRVPKWILLFISTILLLPFIGSIPKIAIPKTLLALFSLLIIYHFKAPLTPLMLDLICFTILTLAAFNAARTSKESFLSLIQKFNIAATILVLGVSYLQIFKVPLGSWFALFPEGNFTSFFGNTIFTGEFLASSFLLLLYGWETSKKKINLVLIFFSTVLIYYLFSRMVIIGLVLAYFLPRLGKRIPLKPAILFIVVLITLALFGIKGPLLSPTILKSKGSSFDQRLSLILNSMAMIKERPILGFGPGRFPISYIPFASAIKKDRFVKEYRLRDDPHSVPVRLAVEFGLPFTFLVLFYWIKLIIFSFKNSITPLNRFLFSVLIFYSVDFWLGFPWMLPYPFFFCAICFGLGLSLFKKEYVLPEVSRRFAFIMSFLLISFRTLSYSISQYYFKNYPQDFGKMGFACNLTPYIWENCYNRVKMGHSYGKNNEVLNISKKIRTIYPGHSAFIKSSALALVKKGQINKACENFEKYEKIVGRGNSLDHLHQHYCRDKNYGN